MLAHGESWPCPPSPVVPRLSLLSLSLTPLVCERGMLGALDMNISLFIFVVV